MCHFLAAGATAFSIKQFIKIDKLNKLTKLLNMSKRSSGGYGGRFFYAGLSTGKSCMYRSSVTGISLHKLPKHPSIKKLWVRLINLHRKDCKSSRYPLGPFLCSEHFLAADFTCAFYSLPGFESKNNKLCLH